MVEAAVNEQHSDASTQAKVRGKAWDKIPSDLYIPPDALRVILDAFEGPLDLLLYLIRRHNVDILNIPMAQITEQYVQYMRMMECLQFELAADYLVMAATLAEIKSRLLLPRSQAVNEEEAVDPRVELVRRLQEYEQFKKAAQNIDALPRLGRDIFSVMVEVPQCSEETVLRPQVTLPELMDALVDVLQRVEQTSAHHINTEKLSVCARMTSILDDLRDKEFVPFGQLFRIEEGRLGVVVSFLALLELMKETLIDVVQTEAFGSIYVSLHEAHSDGTTNSDC